MLRRALTLVLAAGLASCAFGTPKTAPPVEVAAAVVEPPPQALETIAKAPIEPVEMEDAFKGFGVPNCAYLAPKGSEWIRTGGTVDVVFHFHAGQMSERDFRASGVRGVFVSCGYGIGTTGYSRAFAEPTRFGWMMKRLMASIGTATQRPDVHLGRLALASWSAGFASVSRILSVPEWYAATDTVVLLDSLHAQYLPDADPKAKTGPARGADHVDVRMLKHFVRFAADAAAGKKTMVITHSSIIPPDYASTSESTAALLREVGVVPIAVTEAGTRNMSLSLKADEGGLHVRGFRGAGPHDHFDHLHLIGETLGTWVVPHWYYTPPSE